MINKIPTAIPAIMIGMSKAANDEFSNCPPASPAGAALTLPDISAIAANDSDTSGIQKPARALILAHF